MNWGDIGKTLLGLGLPTLGTALGGPLGGAAGKMIADALGTAATPSAVGAALSTDPAVQQKLAETEAEWARTAATIVSAGAQQGQNINATMQAEIASGVSWWHWRHLIGYVTMLWLLAPLPFVVIGMWLLVSSGKADALTAIVTAMGVLVSWVAICAALNGYVASDTTKRTTAAVAGEPVTGIIGLIKAIIKR